jgi:hypothetical protein
MLQSVDNDIFTANHLVNEVLQVLQKRREEHETRFDAIFLRASSIGSELDIPITIPRRASRQTLRANYPHNDPKIYYRQAIFTPYIDYILKEISDRFADQRDRCGALWCLLPSQLRTSSDESISQLIKVD